MYKVQFIWWYIALLAFAALSCDGTHSTKPDSREITNNWELTGFVKVDSLNPILSPSSELSFFCPLRKETVKWEERNVLNPSAIVKGDEVYLFYRAQDSMGTSRIGIAISSDGLHFDKREEPVFFPDQDSMYVYEWNYRKREQAGTIENCKSCYFDGVEDPRIIEDEKGTYWMTYTAYDGDKARLSLASSVDLLKWTKHGLVLKGDDLKDKWSKSGAIIGQLIGNKVITTKINGKYWMYFGDTDLFMAWSEDLVHWQPATDEESGNLISVLHPRKGYFDSRLVEPGPYALKTREGILLIYNGSNAANFSDESYPRFTYAAGQALFDTLMPYKMIDRTENDFIHPEKDYEKVGEVNEVCFVEGLVHFKDKWFLYYGTGDSKIAVAVSDHGPL